MKAIPTMSRFLCDKPVVGREVLTQTCFPDTGFLYLTDDDRDSGTESDDEGAEIEELQKYMESIIHLDSNHRQNGVEQRRVLKRHQASSHFQQQQLASEESPARGRGPATPARHRPPRRRSDPHSPPGPDSALPSDSDHNCDHHSSEEELEVINSSSPRLQHHPEKRKWGGSRDEEAGPEGAESIPVEFRTSPPAHAHKPSKCLRQAHIPSHELCSVSPRKRHRRTPTAIQRPCLDFEKMQQINRVRLL